MAFSLKPPTDTDVSDGDFADLRNIDIFGRNTDIDSSPIEDIWAAGGERTAPTSAGAITVASGSAQDASAGTGLRTVRVHYLDASFVEQTLDLALNGTTNVVSTETDVYRVLEVAPLTAGTDGAAAGDITFTVGGNTQAFIATGESESRLTFYTVPAGYQAFVQRMFFNCARNAEVQCTFWYRTSAVGIWRVVRRLQLNNDHIAFEVPSIGPFATGTDFKITGEILNGSNNREVAAGWNFRLKAT